MNLDSLSVMVGNFFFKNNLLFILLLKKCLYLCQILITKTQKMKARTQIKIGLFIASYFIIRTLINI